MRARLGATPPSPCSNRRWNAPPDAVLAGGPVVGGAAATALCAFAASPHRLPISLQAGVGCAAGACGAAGRRNRRRRQAQEGRRQQCGACSVMPHDRCRRLAMQWAAEEGAPACICGCCGQGRSTPRSPAQKRPTGASQPILQTPPSICKPPPSAAATPRPLHTKPHPARWPTSPPPLPPRPAPPPLVGFAWFEHGKEGDMRGASMPGLRARPPSAPPSRSLTVAWQPSRPTFPLQTPPAAARPWQAL